MSKSETPVADAFGFIIFVLFVLLVGFIAGGTTIQYLVDSPNKKEQMHVVCEYLDAKVSDKVCIKDEKVVYKFKDVRG